MLRLLLLLVLVGCGAHPIDKPYGQISQTVVEHEQLKPIVSAFYRHFPQGKPTKVVIDDFSAIMNEDALTMAYCNHWTNTIHVRAANLEGSELRLKYLMFHELGHCALDLRHEEGTLMDPIIPRKADVLWGRINQFIERYGHE